MAWWRLQADALEIDLRIIPRASRDQLVGISSDRLKLKLTAAPVDGKANSALLRYISELFEVPRSHVCITRGERGREKTIRISPPPPMPQELSALVHR